MDNNNNIAKEGIKGTRGQSVKSMPVWKSLTNPKNY